MLGAPATSSTAQGCSIIMKSTLRLLPLIALVVAVGRVVAADGISGQYVGKGGGGSVDVSITFKVGGKAEVVMVPMVGQKQISEAGYKFEDNKVKLGPLNGSMLVMPMDKAGCLEGGALGRLCKKR